MPRIPTCSGDGWTVSSTAVRHRTTSLGEPGSGQSQTVLPSSVRV